MFVSQAMLKVLAEEFTFSCVALLPPTGRCKTSSGAKVLGTLTSISVCGVISDFKYQA